MPEFTYTARTEAGDVKHGVVQAANEEQAATQLKPQGLVITAIQLSKTQTTMARLNRWLENQQKISLTDRAVFAQNLQIMVRSSIPLAQSLGTLAEQTTNKHFVHVISDMRQSIEKGDTFAKAMQKYEKIFSEVFVNMIAAGEASGKLESILGQLAKQLKKERQLIAKVRGAMFYPAIVTGAMIFIGIFMMIFIIPKITSIYADSGGTLPLPTRVLIGMSNFLVHNGIVVGIVTVIVVIALQRYGTRKSGKHVFHAIILRTPIAGMIIKKINLARFSRTLSSLLQTDIPIVQSFQIIEHTLSNIYYQEAMQSAAASLKKGSNVVDALRTRPKLFPPLVTQMISVGEESGKLDELADEIANFYEEDVDETMANFSSVIEPVLILLLGLGVGGMAIAILLPIYGITQQI